jgi:hypothetical protein
MIEVLFYIDCTVRTAINLCDTAKKLQEMLGHRGSSKPSKLAKIDALAGDVRADKNVRAVAATKEDAARLTYRL